MLASTLPAHSHRPPHGQELVDHYEEHNSGSTMPAGQAIANFAFQRPGTQPPVFIAGSFSNPPWQPHEMTANQKDDGDYEFTKSWPVEQGVDVEYKYRIGHGDWWVLDESEQTTDDGHGNLNNTMSSARFSSASESNESDKPLPSRLGALRDSDSPSRSLTPDFVRTTIEVSDSAALLLEEVPSREIPRHVPAIDLHMQSHTPIEEVAETAAEVADTAATLDQEESSGADDDNDDVERDDPPMLAHECMKTGDEQVSQIAEDHVSPPKDQTEEGDDLASSDVDLDDPRLEKFPSERSAIYAAVRRLSTSIEQDDVGDVLAAPRSPGLRPGDRTLEGVSAASPTDMEASSEGSGLLKASDVSHSPVGDIALKSVSSLQSIPEGDDGEVSTEATSKNKTGKQARALSNTLSSDGDSHADDEGIAMHVPSRERAPKYTWEQKPRGRSGSVTDHDALSATEDAGPSVVAVNHTQTDPPHVLVHGPETGSDGDDDTANSGDDLLVSESQKPKSLAPAQRPDTRTSVRSAQTVASLQKTENSVAWLQSWFRVLFIDFFGGILKKLFGR
ncbi:Glycogen recognition site of AMP-activated protein kinase [Microdochium nivale]|nr:Glycogen recognition site of AMP-activated protein kinase [Microdochium nivale]